MGGDVLAGAAAAVLGDEPAQAVGEAARPGERAAQAARPLQLARRDPQQGDQVVGLPAALEVVLAEADAAAQGAAPGRRVVHRQRRPQLGVRRAEGALPSRLGDLDPATPQAAEQHQDDEARYPVAHGEMKLPGFRPVGWGK